MRHLARRFWNQTCGKKKVQVDRFSFLKKIILQLVIINGLIDGLRALNYELRRPMETIDSVNYRFQKLRS